jgi:hypothetical protein
MCRKFNPRRLKSDVSAPGKTPTESQRENVTSDLATKRSFGRLSIVPLIGPADGSLTNEWSKQLTRQARKRCAMNPKHDLKPFHSLETPEPLSGSVADLYRVYFEIAKRDHAVRRAALYGKQTPPPGHTPFRPIPYEHFETRFMASASVPYGEVMFRKQLARQAAVYGVNPAPLSHRQAA